MSSEPGWREACPFSERAYEVRQLCVAKFGGDVANPDVALRQQFEREPQTLGFDKLRIGDAGFAQPTLQPSISQKELDYPALSALPIVCLFRTIGKQPRSIGHDHGECFDARAGKALTKGWLISSAPDLFLVQIRLIRLNRAFIRRKTRRTAPTSGGGRAALTP